MMVVVVRRLRIVSRGYGGEELPGVCMYVQYIHTRPLAIIARDCWPVTAAGFFGRESVIAVRGDICYVTFGQVVKESTRIDDLPHRFIAAYTFVTCLWGGREGVGITFGGGGNNAHLLSLKRLYCDPLSAVYYWLSAPSLHSHSRVPVTPLDRISPPGFAC